MQLMLDRTYLQTQRHGPSVQTHNCTSYETRRASISHIHSSNLVRIAQKIDSLPLLVPALLLTRPILEPLGCFAELALDDWVVVVHGKSSLGLDLGHELSECQDREGSSSAIAHF